MPTNKGYGSSGLIAVLGLVALLVGFVVRLVLPAIRYTAWALLLLGVILLATAFILDWRRVGSAITGQRGRFSTGTTVMASIFIGITLIVNTISIGNYQRFDLTVLSQFTLTSQTKEVLSQLATPVQVLLFFTPDDPYGISDYATSLLTQYRNYTDQLSLQTIDPDEHPDQARQYGITQYQTVVFETTKGRRAVLPQEIVERAEHAFTSAILEVTGVAQKKVYFLTGHGESDINSQAPNGYSRAKLGLMDNLYQVEALDWVVTSGIPEDSAALIIAAPRQPLTSSEMAMIERYLKNDGWLMMLTNPESAPEIKQLLSAWGVDLADGTAIDPSSYVTPSIDSPIVPRLRNFFGLASTYFPGATALIPRAGYAPKIEVTETETLPPLFWASEDSPLLLYSLVRTSQDSWLEKNFNTLTEPKFEEGIDLKGPLNLAFLIITSATVESEAVKGPRLLVIGDSDFATNQHFYNGNNGDFFINSVNLLTEGTELIAVERKILPFRRLIAGPEITRFINYSSIGLLPLLVLFIGGIVWWRRR